MTTPAPIERTAVDDLTAAFRAHTAGKDRFTRRMAIIIGDHNRMTPMQVVRHYERVGLLKRGSEDWFRINGGFTREHFAEARADRAIALAEQAAQ